MTNNAGTCKIVKFAPCAEVDANLASFAEDFFEVVSTDYADDGTEQLVGYMRQTSQEADLHRAAEQAGIKLPSYQIETLSSDDWLTENVIKFAPVDVAEFLVYGIHEQHIDTHGKIGLKVYAATAFGSEHQTTKACLQALSDINRLLPTAPQKVLDVGTGSGILSLAAAKLWPKAQIVAVDIDDESVKVTAQNAADNKVAEQIIVALSDGYQSAVVRQNAPYDAILANILARPLISMAPDMAAHLKTGGLAVISGFIDEQTDWVVGEHQKHGLTLKKLYCQDNWRAALLEKKS